MYGTIGPLYPRYLHTVRPHARAHLAKGRRPRLLCTRRGHRQDGRRRGEGGRAARALGTTSATTGATTSATTTSATTTTTGTRGRPMSDATGRPPRDHTGTPHGRTLDAGQGPTLDTQASHIYGCSHRTHGVCHRRPHWYCATSSVLRRGQRQSGRGEECQCVALRCVRVSEHHPEVCNMIIHQCVSCPCP